MPIIVENVRLGVFSRKILVVMVVILLRVSFPIKASAADPISTWQTVSTLNYNIANTASSVIENRLYVIAGSNYVGVNTVGFSEIDNNGILGPWNFSSQNVPNGPYWSSVVTNNNRIYKIGGTNYNTNGGIVDSIGDVHIGVPGIGGIIAGWAAGPSLPDGRRISLGQAVKVGSKIYLLGGGTWTNGGSPVVMQDVFVSTINSDGSLSSWSYANRTLPTPLIGHSVIESNGRIIVIGGATTSSLIATNLMYISTVDSLGNLGEWQTVKLPFYARSAMVAKVNGYIVHAGGYAGGFLNRVYYSQLDSNGLPGVWTLSVNSLPGGNCCTAMATWGNRMYIIGGHNGGYLNTVWSATIETTPSPAPTPTPTPTPPLFDLPFAYQGRPNATAKQFRAAFWARLTAAFDHVFATEIFRPFTGIRYTPVDCPSGTTGIKCYDSHNGTDFSAKGKNAVYSVSEGEVVFTSNHNESSCVPNKGGFGCVVIVQYPENIYGLYAHLKEIFVSAGDHLTESSLVGRMGETGCPGCGVHLHFATLSPIQTSISTSQVVTSVDWSELLYEIKPNLGLVFKPFCSYTAPNGIKFRFFDPFGWKGKGTDPWSKPKSEGGCGIESPYLWKVNVGVSP